jgi:hypothetical protein
MTSKETLNRYSKEQVRHKYPKASTALKKALTAFLIENDLGCDAFFCSPNVWRTKEAYCGNSDLVLSIDGSPLYAILNYGEGGPLQDRFDKICTENGYYYEFGCSWYLGFYKL